MPLDILHLAAPCRNVPVTFTLYRRNMNSADAEAVSVLLLQLNAKMNDSVWLVKEKGTPEEFEKYRRRAAEVMGSLLEAAEFVYAMHPQLRPDYLDGSYVVNPDIFKDRFYVPKDDAV